MIFARHALRHRQNHFFSLIAIFIISLFIVNAVCGGCPPLRWIIDSPVEETQMLRRHD
jgi:hypothetical protein